MEKAEYRGWIIYVDVNVAKNGRHDGGEADSGQVPRSSVNEAEWQGSVSGNKAEWWAAKSDDVHFEGARALEEEKEMTGKKQRGAKRTPTSLPDPSCL